jgi:hypothetical protein
MQTWLIFAILITIAVTALLMAVLYRINLPAIDREATRREGEGADPTYAAMARNGDHGRADDDGGD